MRVLIFETGSYSDTSHNMCQVDTDMVERVKAFVQKFGDEIVLIADLDVSEVHYGEFADVLDVLVTQTNPVNVAQRECDRELLRSICDAALQSKDLWWRHKEFAEALRILDSKPKPCEWREGVAMFDGKVRI